MKKQIINKSSFVISGNYYDKYRTKNKLEKILVNNFIKNIKVFAQKIDYKSLLDVGCGEGYITNLISGINRCRIVGIDIDNAIIEEAKKKYPHISFIKGSVYKLPFEDRSFDFVMATEVLEHLENPDIALREIKRVARKWIVLSIPLEPLWRVLNVVRGKYLRFFGNTPGHVQHWSVRNFTKLVSRYFKILELKKSIPWLIVFGVLEERN